MEATYQWLRQYCPVDLTPEQVDEALTMSGTEIEERERHTPTDDVAFKAEITSNRPDCYSVLGLARELSALTGTPLTPPRIEYPVATDSAAAVSNVTLECPDLCPYYTLQVIRGVKVGPSPKWLIDRLEALAGVKSVRPVNNVVDITNFVLLELGQPLHAFDASKMAGGRIVVRRAAPGETLTAITGEALTFSAPPAPSSRKPGVDYSRHAWSDDICVIADADRPQCVGGVMGGRDSEITAATTDILLESAYFAPIANRATARLLGLHSDSSYRFSRGVDPAMVMIAQRRCAQLIVENCGGEVLEGVIEAGSLDIPSWTVPFRHAAIARTLGIDVPRERVAALFTGLGLTLTGDATADTIEVHVPSHRRDLTREIDLVEEVGRLVGYHEIPVATVMTAGTTAPSKAQRVVERTRDLLVGAGYHETITDSFVPDTPRYAASPWKPAEHSGDGVLRAANPVATGQGLLRPTLVPSLLAIRKSNQDRGSTVDVAIFELGRIFTEHARGSAPPASAVATPAHERIMLAATIDGADAFARVKGLLESLAADLQLALQFEPTDVEWLTAGRRSVARLADTPVAYLGEVDEQVLAAFELQQPCAAIEIDLAPLTAAANLQRVFVDLPRFMPIDRELALVLPEAATWDAVEAAIRTATAATSEAASDDASLRDVAYLGEYRGKQIEKGHKQYNLRLTFRADDRTLTSAAVDNALAPVVAALGSALGARLRE